MAGLIGKFENFDPDQDDWIVYSESLEQHFEANKITEEKEKVATLLTVVGKSIYRLLRDLTYPELPKEKTFMQLSEIMRKQLSPHVSVWRERIKFYNATQREDESSSEWNARIRNLAVNCNLGSRLQENLKDKFICMMKKGAVQDRLCEENEQNSMEIYVTLVLQKESSKNAVSNVLWVKLVNGGFRHFIPKGKTMMSSAGPGLGNMTSGQSYQHQQTSRTTATHARGRRRFDRTIRNQQNDCKVCGKHAVSSIVCKYANYRCRKCNSIGHLEAVCRSRVKNHNFINEQVENINIDQLEIFNLSSDKSIKLNPFIIEIKIGKEQCKMSIDTGAAITVISLDLYDSKFSKYVLTGDNIILRGYTGDCIKPIGYFEAPTTVNNITKSIRYYVVNKDGPSLLGRNFFKSL
ncbi:hypothetical protein NQ314_002370 [Rhamnusium bicolor]|uniref:Peptidase A2 domain-containing protein n=1 Tax=Rhamnusium bicolor TaxID=1586634 RepID=A0AAV8ZRH9_9CUCU|nr:hypothetical protein NQ314_002370 [Rhamnusium bicolor]